MNPLVSVIIPTYNRAHLIGETLDSISRQTYTNWECIVVDDGSTDNTETLLQRYVQKDSRFQFIKRPQNKIKGANVCRNIGFDYSKGDFIQWFDSDDIMLSEFLEFKVDALKDTSYDYLITLTEDFQHPDINTSLGVNKNYYTFNLHKITHYNYCTQKLNWLTPDLFLKRQCAKQIKYNEYLKSGQEFNFNCKLTAVTNKVLLKEEVLTKRRMHSDSVKGNLLKNQKQYILERGLVYYQNWLDLKRLKLKSTTKTLSYFFRKAVNVSINMQIDYPLKNIVNLSFEFMRLGKIKPFSLYLIYQFFGRVFKKGHFVRKLFLKSLE
ncbi:glycosyltransferase family 2 protein [Yeosuana marina]|uniref:glycosyltransferase family 2 protein n=1 Tax=Yeosuana marina TaxID=1565536 RepID=UPI0030EFA0C7|tara:strand:+ start:1164 stop:2132 length:969 start_codon:yes stop_codon:yes gene_type:complete